MDEQLKKRLIGAIVLVALAVIFVPMLLEGPTPGAQKSANGIPNPPPHKFKTMDIPLQVPAPAPKGTVGEGTAAGEAARAAAASQQAPAAGTPLSVVQAPPPAAAKPVPAPAPEQSTAAAKPAPQPAPQAAPMPAKPAVTVAKKPATTETWVVQLGSFSDSGKAVALRNKLRAKHYAAYLEKVRAGGRLFYRVRVGPMAKRAEAEHLQGEIDRALRIKGMVMHR